MRQPSATALRSSVCLLQVQLQTHALTAPSDTDSHPRKAYSQMHCLAGTDDSSVDAGTRVRRGGWKTVNNPPPRSEINFSEFPALLLVVLLPATFGDRRHGSVLRAMTTGFW